MNPYHQGQLDFFCAIYAFVNAMRLLFGIRLNQSREILATALREISAQPALWQAVLDNRTDHHWAVTYLLGRFCGPGGFPARIARLPAAPLTGLAGAGESEITGWLALSPPPPVSLQHLGVEDLYRPEVEFGPRKAPAPGVKTPERLWNSALLWPLLQRWLDAPKFGRLFGLERKWTRCLLLRFHRFEFCRANPVISHWSAGRDFSGDTLNLYDCTAGTEGTRALPRPEVALYPEELDSRRNLALEPQSVVFLEKY